MFPGKQLYTALNIVRGVFAKFGLYHVWLEHNESKTNQSQMRKKR